MRATRAPVGMLPLLLLLLLCLLCPPSWLGLTRPSVSAASASLATASWPNVWVDEFESENVDTTKWELPRGVSTRDKESREEAARRGDRETTGTSTSSTSTSPEEPPHHTPPRSSPHPQVYIGAHEYLVISAVAPPSPPPPPPPPPPPSQPVEGGDLQAAVSDPGSRIRTSVDFQYGRLDVRAKVAPEGLSGFWLRPAKEVLFGHTPCACVAIAEVLERGGGQPEHSTSTAKASVRFGDYEDDEWGCTSSGLWPNEDDDCSLPTAHGVDWSDAFHVYSLEWQESEFRWYIDGKHYCTKTSWFAKQPDDFPAPFNTAFYLEMGVEAVGGVGEEVSSAGEEGGTPSTSVVRPVMLVDYVRIAQGPAGMLFPPSDDAKNEGFDLDADGGAASAPPPSAVDVFFNAIAVSACVLGPYMAMTGLRRPRTNTILMGVEIGAFKAANASYLLSGSYVMALTGAVMFGMLIGFIAIRHRAMARWNTVAGLSVPVLFLLIDVGMISDIGSRYVCWAIFFVLTVTFAVLVFPPEHHAVGFAVASAATGSCVLKLGLGWLLGESGEIFKILDDPLGDRCHVSRVCQYLNFVMAAMFLIGLCFQWILKPSPEDKLPGLGYSEADPDKQRQPLFTPPRSRFPWRGPVVRSDTMPPTRKSTAATGGDFEPNGGREASNDTAAGVERQAAFGAVGEQREEEQERQSPENDDTLSEGYDDDEAFILGLPGARGDGGGIWQRATSGARRILDRVLHPISSYRHHQVPVGVRPDSPTPVPMPPSGPESNTVVSNQGDTIELVVNSPHKSSLGHRQPPGWLGDVCGGGAGEKDGGDHHRPQPPLNLRDGAEEGEEEDGRRQRQQGLSAGSTSSSSNYDDALSILSASELVAAEDLAAATSAGRARPDAEAAANEGAPSGRLADAFSEKWGAWVEETRSSDDGSADGRGGRNERNSREGARSACGGALGREGGDGGGSGGRSAREFDDEALLLSPYVPPPPDVGTTPNLEAGATPGAAEPEDDRDRQASFRLSHPSSSSSVYDERWVWRRRDGVLPPSSSNESSGRASSQGCPAVADGGPDLPAGLGGNTMSRALGAGASGRSEGEQDGSSGTGPPAPVVELNSEVMSSVVPLDGNSLQRASGGSPAASLREIDL